MMTAVVTAIVAAAAAATGVVALVAVSQTSDEDWHLGADADVRGMSQLPPSFGVVTALIGVALINSLPRAMWSAPFSLFFVRPSAQKELNRNPKIWR